MRAFQHRELIANGGFGTGDIVHPEPRRHGSGEQQRHPDERRVAEPQGCAVRLIDAANADKSEDRHEDHYRREQLHHADAEVTQAAVHAEGAALLRFRVEKTDVAHAGGKVSSGKTAEQSDENKYPEWGCRVLHRDPKPQAGHH